MLPPVPRVAKSAPSEQPAASVRVGVDPLVPGATPGVALAAAVVAVGARLRGAARGGRHDGDAALAMALDDVRRRAAEAVAVAGPDRRDARMECRETPAADAR
jgi:hypothetical protein